MCYLILGPGWASVCTVGCVQMCILYVVSATEVHGWEGFRAR